MAKANAGGKKATKVRDLTARKGAGARGGSMGSAVSNTVNAIGDGLTQVARKS